MALTSTQIGKIGENLLMNSVMTESEGRLSPFSPIADDDGLDILFFDKQTGGSIALQLKCRNRTNPNKPQIYFKLRKATFNGSRNTFLVAALFNSDRTKFECMWLIPMSHFNKSKNGKSNSHSFKASIALDSKDKFLEYRYLEPKKLAAKILQCCKNAPIPAFSPVPRFQSKVIATRA